MNVEIGTEALISLLWEYLFRNFGILSLQCRRSAPYNTPSVAWWRIIGTGGAACKGATPSVGQ
jgi:hypothetical protein